MQKYPQLFKNVPQSEYSNAPNFSKEPDIVPLIAPHYENAPQINTENKPQN
jgi:hypothetical protein